MKRLDKLHKSSTVELCEELNDKFEKEVAAFLNGKEGGDVYIGVDEDGDAVGLSDIYAVQRAAADRIRSNIQPEGSGLFAVEKVPYQGRLVLRIIVSDGPEKPYFIRRHGMSPEGCFIRIGSSSQPMTRMMLNNLYAPRL